MTRKPTEDSLASFSTRPTAHRPDEQRQAPRKAPTPKSARAPFSTHVDRDLADEVRRLALQVSADRGERVSVADLVEEALRDLVERHRRR